MTTDVMTDAPGELPEAKSANRVHANASIYMVSQLVSWLVTFVALSLVPRALGERGVGQLGVATTTLTIPMTLLMFGIEMFLVKEVGRDRSQAPALVNGAVGLRVILLVPMALVAVAAMYVFGADSLTWRLFWVLLPGTFLSFSLYGPARAALTGWEDARYVALGDIAGPITTLILLPLPLRLGVLGAAISSTVAMAACTTALLLRLTRRMSLKPMPSLPTWRHLTRGGMPFFVNNYVLVLYSAATVYILKRMAGEENVGLMTQSTRLMGTFLFVPTALSSALLPSISRMAHEDPEKLKRVEARFMSLLMTLSFPVATSMFLLAGPICHLLYGPVKFAALPPVLMVGAVTLIPLYFVSTMYQFLVAQNQARVWTIFLLGTVAVNIVGCLLLIPWTKAVYHNGALGASMAILVAESASTICAFVILGVNPFDRESLGRTLRGILATSAMAGVIYGVLRSLQGLPIRSFEIASGLQVVIPAAAGFIAFSILAWYLHILAPEERETLSGMLRRKLPFLAR